MSIYSVYSGGVWPDHAKNVQKIKDKMVQKSMERYGEPEVDCSRADISPSLAEIFNKEG